MIELQVEESQIEKIKSIAAKTHPELIDGVVLVDALQDEYCTIREKFDPAKKKFDILKKELETAADKLLFELDASHDKAAEGIRKTAKWLLSFTAKRKSTTLTDKKKLLALLGADLYLELSEISVENMRKYLTPQQLKLVATEDYTGKRTLKVAKNK